MSFKLRRAKFLCGFATAKKIKNIYLFLKLTYSTPPDFFCQAKLYFFKKRWKFLLNKKTSQFYILSLTHVNLRCFNILNIYYLPKYLVWRIFIYFPSMSLVSKCGRTSTPALPPLTASITTKITFPFPFSVKNILLGSKLFSISV